MRYLSTLLVVLVACGDEKVPVEFDVQDVNVTTAEDTPIAITVPVSSNRPLVTVTLSAMPMHGTVVASNNNTLFTYTPALNYDGPDTLSVTFDNGTDSKTGTAHITVTPVDDAPVANADSFAVKFNTTTMFDDATLLANDTDVDSTNLTVVSVTPIEHGSPAHAGTQVTFIPEANYQGAASFTYTISDGQLTAIGTVSVTIGNNSPPVANPDTVAGTEDTPATVTTATLLANDTDADHQTLAVTGVSSPTHGTVTLANGTVTFTPDLNYNGAATFQYGVTDGADVTFGTVTVNLAPVNDPPVVPNYATSSPEDTTLAITSAALLAAATDVDGDTLTVVGVKNPQNCTVSLAGGTVTFLPTLNFNGDATFTFTVSDGTVSVDALATVTVTPVNDAPVGVDDMLVTSQNVPITVPASQLLANDTDVDGDTLSISAVSNPTNGTVTMLAGNITFTPTNNFSGVAGFDYTVTDGALTGTAHVTVTVNHINHNPVAVNDMLTTNEETPVTGNVVVNDMDVDGDTLTVSAVSQGSNGTVVFSGGTVTYTPGALFHGVDTFNYVVSDGHGGSASAMVTVTVNFVNHAPNAVTDTLVIMEDTVGTINVLLNDTDAEGDPLTVTAFTQGANGATVMTSNGIITYTPVKDFNGGDIFHYTVIDGQGGTATGTVNVTVTPVDDPPVAQPDFYTDRAGQNLVVAAPGVLANDTDIDSTVLTAVLVTQPICGTLVLNANGGFTYTPQSLQCSSDTFSYKASDGTLFSDPVIVTIAIVPVAVDDAYTTFDCGDSECICVGSGVCCDIREKANAKKQTATRRPTQVKGIHGVRSQSQASRFQNVKTGLKAGLHQQGAHVRPKASLACGSGPQPNDNDVSVYIEDDFGDVDTGTALEYTIFVDTSASCSTAVIHPELVDNFPSELTNVTWNCFGVGCNATSGTGSIDQVLAMAPNTEVEFDVTGSVVASPGDDIEDDATALATDYNNLGEDNFDEVDNFVDFFGVQNNDIPQSDDLVSTSDRAPGLVGGQLQCFGEDGSFRYQYTGQCLAGDTLTDTFTYHDDLNGQSSNIATVTLTIPCNDEEAGSVKQSTKAVSATKLRLFHH